MSEQVLVLLEINVVEGVPTAERLTETLLEAGFDQPRILMLAAREIQVQVRHRPVVTLTPSGEEGSQPKANNNGGGKSARKAAVTPEPEAEAESYQQNGVRFSEAFRSA